MTSDLKQAIKDKLETEIKAWRHAVVLNELEPILLEVVDSLVFVSMPITNANRTAESLLETIENDSIKAKEALTKLKNWSEKK